MTSELTSEAPRADDNPPVEAEVGRGDDAAIAHLRLAVAFLAVSSVLLAAAAARLVFPDLASDVPVLSYGRLYPAAVNLLVYGWLTLGLIGAGYYILPRLSGTPLRRQGTAVFAGGVLAAAYLAGSVAVLFGGNEGRQYLEFPIWADAAIVVGLLLVVRVFTGHIASSAGRGLAPADWYFGAAVVWLLLSHIAGSVPGLNGVNEALQTSFYRGALFGMWLAAAGLGTVYYLVSVITGRDPRRVSQLTVAGFWSVGFVFAMSSAARLTYSAAPDWLETIGTVFGIGLFVPVAIILVDVATALRGRGRASGAVRFVVAGTVAFALIPVLNLGLGLRSSNAIVGKTDWVIALDLLALLGAFTFWLLAFYHHTSGSLSDGSPGRSKGHLALSAVAVLAAVGTLLVSGVQSGLTWVADANEGVASAGDAFEATAGGRDGHLWVGFVALAVFALTQVWFAAAARRLGAAGPVVAGLEAGALVETDAAEEPGEEPDAAEETEAAEAAADDLDGLPLGVPVSLGRLRSGTIGVFAIVALFLFVFPILEAEHRDATLLAESSRDYESGTQIDAGRDVYLAEGCWYCHTQEVRAIVTDVGLGPVSQPGDYALEDPSVAGVARVGPDLMFAGSRGVEAAFVAELLEDPRSVRPWSTMPAHDYLSDGDIAAVAAYVAALDVYVFN